MKPHMLSLSYWTQHPTCGTNEVSEIEVSEISEIIALFWSVVGVLYCNDFMFERKEHIAETFKLMLF